MKYFVVSDIHGHFDELMAALDEANFNPEEHTLIVLGDMFDRGMKSQEVYQYIKGLYDLGQAIVIKGNHELFLFEVNELNEKRMLFNIEKNGFQFTLNSFCEEDVTGKPIEYIRDLMNEKNPELIEWLNEIPFYYETENYIFVHAGLNTEVEDWHDCDWTRAVWTKTRDFRDQLLTYKGIVKNVVHGHVSTQKLREHDGIIGNDYSVYFSKDGQKIGIDGNVYKTKKINVFVIEEEFECLK